ncbi:MAG TPA: Gldg family protein [Anaerolineales bacterium]|nr:Gldg family protein [Anaerolineales bacterium]
MNNPQQPNRYEKIPLILSLIGLIATILLALVKATMALGMFTPEDPETINLALSISAAVTLLGLAVYAMLAPDTVRNFLTGRQARYGSNALIMMLAFAGIIFVANYLAYKNPVEPLDLTEDKQNTLSTEMVTVLENLPDKMTAVAYYSQIPRDDAQSLLENMKVNSKGNFDYRFVDPVADPLEAKNAGVTGDGKIVLSLSGRREIADYADETELLRAMNRLLKPEARTVYFLAGHGERDINGSGQTGMSRARETLENKNYTVKALNLLADNRVPADALAIIIAGPTQPLSPAEIGLLNKYAQQGGALIVMEDPIPFTDFGDTADPLAESLERVWGIRLRNDFVVDTASTSIQNAIGANYSPAHPVTNAMTLYTIFPLARSIEVSTQLSEQISLTSLVETSPDSQSWGETDFSALEQNNASVALDPETDTPGPLTLVVAGENLTSQGRVVVFGNSIFASDEGFDAYGNGDLFVNAVDWAAGDDAPVDITIRPPTERTFNAPGQIQWLAILLGSVCILPGVVLGAGIAAWVSRKRRG